MDADEATFVETMTEHLYGRGMQRMAARMLAWLLICDPPEQTAAQLADALQVSRAAISGAARDLTTTRLVRRSVRRGDRREYFSVPPAQIRTLINAIPAVLSQGREIADEGLAAMADRPPGTRARLQEFRDIYAHFEREWPGVVQSYLRSTAAADADDSPTEPTRLRAG